MTELLSIVYVLMNLYFLMYITGFIKQIKDEFFVKNSLYQDVSVVKAIIFK